MITDSILGILIVCDIASFLFCLILCFLKAPNWVEVEVVVRSIAGLFTMVLSYYISQLFITGFSIGGGSGTFDPALNTFFFWFMGGFSLLYIVLVIVIYVGEKLDDSARKIATNVNAMAKQDLDAIREDMYVAPNQY